VRPEPPDRPVERRPQVGPPAEEAHFEQVVDRFNEYLILHIGGIGHHLERTSEQAVRGVDIPIAVEQVIGARDCSSQ
jgi:hypothetical protein